MSATQEWCRMIEGDIAEIKQSIKDIQTGNQQLIKIVVVGLLTIAGAVVGVKLI